VCEGAQWGALCEGSVTREAQRGGPQALRELEANIILCEGSITRESSTGRAPGSPRTGLCVSPSVSGGAGRGCSKGAAVAAVAAFGHMGGGGGGGRGLQQAVRRWRRRAKSGAGLRGG
jgi:hypothetical protein